MSLTPQIKRPELLERNKAQTTQLAIISDGANVNCTGGTYTLRNSSGQTVVTGAVVPAGGVATFSHTAGSLPDTLILGEGYQQLWDLDLDGETENRRFDRNVSLVLRRLYPVISDFDLLDEYPALNQDRPSTLPSWQTFLDSAWNKIIQDLRKKGNLEYLVMTPDSMREVHLNETLYKIFRAFHSFAGNSGGSWFDLAKEHQELAKNEWDTLTFEYDYTHKGQSKNSTKRATATPIVFLNG